MPLLPLICFSRANPGINIARGKVVLDRRLSQVTQTQTNRVSYTLEMTL